MAVPDRCLETVASFDPNYMTVAICDDDQGRFSANAAETLLELCRKSTSVGLGPGLGRGTELTRLAVELYLRCPRPMVVDADALNALALHVDQLSQAVALRILTPHIGEFRRLVGEEIPVEACRKQAAKFAAKHGVVLVLKGHQTLVTNGEKTYHNHTGNPGMATGGAGDVLTGVVTALLGCDLTPLEAAVCGVHVHGLAGDLARDERGEIGMVAEDIKNCLPQAFMQQMANQER